MKCNLCSKQGASVNGLRFAVVACEEHTKQLITLETQYKKRVTYIKGFPTRTENTY
jgi:hypothetical protein